MIAAGILGPDDRTELLDGILVVKMSKNSERTISDDLVRDSLSRRLPTGWFYRTQDPIALDVSEPEPDFFVARGKPTDYRGRQPSADEVALVVEVAESSLSRDRNWKSVIYARNRIPVYWIVNLLDSTLEV